MTKATTAKTATAKTPKTPKTPKTATAKTPKTTAQKTVANFSLQFAEVLTARNIEQYSKDTELAINAIKSSAVAIDKAMTLSGFDQIKSVLLNNARIADSKTNKANFIAVKVLVKIVHTLTAIGQNMTSTLDPYTRTIVENMIALNKMSNKSALVSLSKSIEYSELEQTDALKKRYNCSVGTASTQASSTRMMLKNLQVCEVSKGKKGDVMTFIENDNAKHFIALFA